MVVHSKTCKKQSAASGKCVCGWKEPDPIILKPCPFCGGPGHLDKIVGTRGESKGKNFYTVGCNTRGCHGDVWHQAAAVPEDKKRSIVDAWNKRA